MELLLLFVMSVVVAIMFNFIAPRFYQSKVGARFAGSFAMHTLGTAIVIFGAVYVAALLMSAVRLQEPHKLPTLSNPTAA